MTYKNVLVEIEETDVDFINPLIVTYNFRDVKVGSCSLTLKKDGIYATIFLPVFLGEGMYPCLSILKEKSGKKFVECLSLCTSPNQDNRIKQLT